jgi:hypothetical protein
MNEWKPGMPILTAADEVAWRQWRKDSKREAQRTRRARYPRIDYYPDDAAVELIRSRAGRFVGGDYSSVINRIVGEWVELCHRNTETAAKAPSK